MIDGKTSNPGHGMCFMEADRPCGVPTESPREIEERLAARKRIARQLEGMNLTPPAKAPDFDDEDAEIQ